MANTAPQYRQPYVVARPRASDAVGMALRNAYDGNARLPDDMNALLLKLNVLYIRRD